MVATVVAATNIINKCPPRKAGAFVLAVVVSAVVAATNIINKYPPRKAGAFFAYTILP